jgi:aspartyl-tRNA(Asn)/glutamyl-tRNA(Gln) amidotransferase subunit A
MEREIMNEYLTLAEVSAAIHAGDTTSVEVTTELLERADRLDPVLGTYLVRFDEAALAAAAALDAELAAGHDRGPLHGVPLGIKDIIATDDGPTTAQSLILDPAWGDQGDAPVVRRLREAGGVIAGKTTTCEFAIGMPDDTKPFPVPRNPWDTTTWPGGSSSGTGSGVAAGLFFGGLGTDTGGSIRLPAAFCGISGHKPTFGLVPKSGCTPLGYTYDHIGPMARSAQDCALMLAVMAGYDASDPMCSPRTLTGQLSFEPGPLTGLRIGVDRTIQTRHVVDPALAGCLDDAVAALADAGATILDITIPHYEALSAATALGFLSEGCAYHAADLQARWADYGRATRLTLARGAFVSSGDYVQSQRVRQVGARAMAALFETLDAVVTPTAGVGALTLADLDFESVMESVFTPVWNAVGYPAISVPMGFTATGLPLGLQIAAAPLSDAIALKAGMAYQAATTWHLQSPQPVLPSLA